MFIQEQISEIRPIRPQHKKKDKFVNILYYSNEVINDFCDLF